MFKYYVNNLIIESESINDLKDFVNDISDAKLKFAADVINYKSVNIIDSDKPFLPLFMMDIFNHVKGDDLPNYISDFIFSVEVDYQKYYDLDENNFDVVH